MLDTLTSRVKSIEQEQKSINYEKVQSSSHLNSIHITKYQQMDHQEENARASTVHDVEGFNQMRRARHRVDSESGQSISASRGRLPSNDRIDVAQTS